MASPLVKYENFLLSNATTISSIESSLRSLTWFLPGRFRDAELASEALSAFLNLMSLYHDTLLSRVARSDPKYKPLIPPSQHSRYTRSWSEGNLQYKWAARALETIRFTELVIEMGLRRKVSSKMKWRGIVLIEMVKAVLRLLLLKLTRRPLVTPPIPEREFDPTTIPPSSVSSSPTLAPSSPPLSPTVVPEHLRNNHLPLDNSYLTKISILSSDAPVEELLLSKPLFTSSVKTPTSLLKELGSPGDWVAETLFVLRPLVYVTMLSRKPKSTNPLVVSLALELIARYLRRTAPPSASLERSEYGRRDRDLLWYLLRGSIWESYTRPKLVSFADKTSNIPIFNLIGAVVKDWVPLIEDYYYYTAT